MQEIETSVESVNTIELRQMPNMLLVVYQRNQALEIFDKKRYRKWLNGMPIVHISPAFVLDEIINGSDMHEFGYIVPLEKAYQLKLNDTEHAKIIKAGLHATTVIYSEGADHVKAKQLTFLLHYLEQQGYKPTGDAWGMTICSFSDGKVGKKYHRMFLPVAPL